MIGTYEDWHKMLKDNIKNPDHIFALTPRNEEEREFFKGLVEYLNENKEITLEEYMKIAHLSKQLAENTLIKLCVMHTLAIKYKNGKCVLVLDDSSLLAI